MNILIKKTLMKFKKTFHKKNENIYLSKIKYDVLNFISNFIKENNFSPTFIEVGKKFRRMIFIHCGKPGIVFVTW